MPSITKSLQQHGAIIEIKVLPSLYYLKALEQSGRRLQPVEALALIDTGASCSCVSSRIIQKLDIQPRSTTLLHTQSTGAHPVERCVFDLFIQLMLGESTKNFQTLAVIEGNPATPNVDALIGRDILNSGILIFNGQSDQYSLCF